MSRTLGVLAGSVALLVLARSAAACSYAEPPPELRGVPSDGQEDVPTDVVPVYSVSSLNAFGDPSGLFRLRSVDGDEVAITTSPAGNWHGELRPEAALEPFTAYVVEAYGRSGEEGVTVSLTFTTGAGPLARAPEPPPAFVQHFELAPDAEWSSCDTDRGTCLAVPRGDLYLLTYDGGVAPDPGYLIDGPYATDYSGISGIQCLEVRRRAINGSYSEPTRVCLGDAPSFVLEGDSSMTCTEAGIVHAGALVTDTPETSEPPPEAPPASGAPAPVDTDGDDAQDDASALAENSDARTNEAVGCDLRRSPSTPIPAALALALAAWTARRRRTR